MQIARVDISNFRGISKASIRLDGTTVFLGDNNTGKSSVLEAIELTLGPDRLYRRPPINEHDFYGGSYLESSIAITVTIVGLTAELRSRFRSNIEHWDATAGEVRAVSDIVPDDEACVRIEFEGRYDAAEDDFVGETWFSSPAVPDGERRPRCTASDKRSFGFLLLRALRTGSRALSMERGSLLDVVLRTYEVEVQMWEHLLDRLRSIDIVGAKQVQLADSDQGDLAVDDEPLPDKFVTVLASLDSTLRDIVSAEWAGSPHLRVSDLTREELRRTLRAFNFTGASGHAAPFQKQGSGTTNSVVIAMLSMIARQRDGAVIFAVEEPEISLPPTTQKRVIDLIREISGNGQALFTSHSPYVLEEFEPEEMTVLSRDHSTGEMTGTSVVLPHQLKRKMFKEGMRTRFAEALLARRVVICEGKSETVAYPYVGKRARHFGETAFGRLDTDGWAVLDAGSETNVAPLAEFFRGLGKQVVSIFDKQDTPRLQEIERTSDLAIEQPYKGFEDLLMSEVPIKRRRAFVDKLIAEGIWPAHISQPGAKSDDDYDKALRRLLTKAKGEPTAIELIRSLSLDELPVTMTSALRQIRLLTVPIPAATESDSENADPEAATR